VIDSVVGWREQQHEQEEREEELFWCSVHYEEDWMRDEEEMKIMNTLLALSHPTPPHFSSS
jgi:hypothetical protein